MLSINMRVFKTVFLIVALFSHRIECLPVENEATIGESLNAKVLDPSVDHYDQRQNGTDNYRVHIDGVSFIFTPAEALILASAANAGKPILSMLDQLKPTSSKPELEPRPSPAPKSTNRAGVHLANLLGPLLQRLRQN